MSTRWGKVQAKDLTAIADPDGALKSWLGDNSLVITFTAEDATAGMSGRDLDAVNGSIDTLEGSGALPAGKLSAVFSGTAAEYPINPAGIAVSFGGQAVVISAPSAGTSTASFAWYVAYRGQTGSFTLEAADASAAYDLGTPWRRRIPTLA